MPHEVLIRYLTYWSEAIDRRKYVVESDILHGFVYTTVQVLKAIKIYLQTLLLSDLLYIFAIDSLYLGKTFKQA